jgi:hypothetical protein
MIDKISFFLFVIFNNFLSIESCGVSQIGKGNIIGGSFVRHGEYPWYTFKINKIQKKLHQLQ